MERVLVVDDEKNIVELVRYNLEKNGFTVITAAGGEEALQKVEDCPPHLVVLDLMLPEMDGLEVCRALKLNPKTAAIPVIMLTARGEETDRVVGLEMGADDYVVKPFSPRELVARVKARLRERSRWQEQSIKEEQEKLIRGDLVLNLSGFLLTVKGKEIPLTPKEFELLHLLMANPGRVYRRDYLLERVWGYESSVDTRTVDVHVRYLRQKIEQDPANPQYIETVRGIGYRFTREEKSYD